MDTPTKSIYLIIIAAFHEMDENHDGAVTQSEFIEVSIFLYLSIIYFYYLSFII